MTGPGARRKHWGMTTISTPQSAVRAITADLEPAGRHRRPGQRVRHHGPAVRHRALSGLPRLPRILVLPRLPLGVASRPRRPVDLLCHHARRAELFPLFQFGDNGSGGAVRRSPCRGPIPGRWPSAFPGCCGGRSAWPARRPPGRSAASGRPCPNGPGPARPVLAGMGRVAGPLLGTGEMRLTGTAPNGQGFRVAPRQIWAVRRSQAVLDGADLGTVAPLATQSRLADFRLPQRGLCVIGTARFDSFDPQSPRLGPAHRGNRTPRRVLGSTIEHVAAPRTPSGPPPRAPSRAELLAALSVAIDLGLGQPAEHMLRAALIGTRIADRLGLDRDQRDCVYYATLVMWIGCHADSHEFAHWFGDDISVRRDSYHVDWAGLPYFRFLAANIGRGEPLTQRLTSIATLFVNARGNMSQLIHSHCTSAALLADRMGLGSGVQDALGFSFERYDGRGLPGGVRGEDIPIEMRVAQLADMAEVHHRTGGVSAAVDMVTERSGHQFDPKVVDVFTADAEAILAGPPAGEVWEAALSCAPDRHQPLQQQSLDELLVALGRFRRSEMSVHAWPFARGRTTGRRRRRGGRLGRRHGHPGPPGRPRPRPRPHRRLQPGLVQAGDVVGGRVRAHAPAPVPHHPHPEPDQRPRAGRPDRRKPPRVRQRHGLSAQPARRRTRHARPGARRRRRLPISFGAKALPHRAGSGGGRSAGSGPGPRRRAGRCRRRGRPARGRTPDPTVRGHGPTG